MKPKRNFKSVYKYFKTSGTLLVKGGFQCELNQFILAASTQWATCILLFWFQRVQSTRSALMTCANELILMNVFFFKNTIHVDVSHKQLAANVTLHWFHCSAK